MPVSALPSRIGAGELGEAAFHFIELLKKNHVKIWQILPLNPVGYGNSPYQPYQSGHARRGRSAENETGGISGECTKGRL